MTAARGMGARTWAARLAAGRAAGMSRHQVVQALRVAAIPAEEFERAVEAPAPPTVTTLARVGTRAMRGHRLRPGTRLRAALRAVAALDRDELRELLDAIGAEARP